MTVKSQSKTVVLPKRSEVPVADQWDLTPLAASDAAWEKDFKKWEKQIEKYAQFKGKLAKSVRNVAELLRFDADFNRLMERVCRYAFLKTAGDLGDSVYQRMLGRARHVMVKAAEASSYMRPELLAIPVAKMKKFMNSPVLAEWKLDLERIVRHRPHTLSNAEEQLLAMTGQMAAGANHVFQQLTGADLKWPTMKDEKGVLVELDHSSFAKFLWSPKRAVRKEAFHLYNGQFDAHKNTIAATYNTSVQQDVFYAKVRKHKSALEASLFQDNVPVKVYDSLIAAVHKYLPVNHRYLALRGKVLGIKDGKGGGVRMYDTYVPMVAGVKKHHTWDEAVKVVVEAMGPLGTEYCGVLAEGLGAARWADRYPNKGKNPGAFSSGGFDGPAYILMNYQPEVLNHVFTLAHEAGHSMHTWYSARYQPYQYYHYPIFLAEVASTFNEQLLLKYMLDRAKGRKEKAYLINHAIDEIRGTLIRQTMFAEFEKISHELVEKGEPLTIDLLRGEYRKLLELYFGAKGQDRGKISQFVIDPELELECLRVGHFYRAFYVYKYATGLSAAIALSQRVLNGGTKELADYMGFLKGGCSKWPLDLLRGAGVDMEKPQPVETALKRFRELVEELEELV